ncbi:MAG TPA: PHP domain-containing protein [Phycisphaerae bacterium]|nr:PHP domain-containing protein [Phycisphaerae bacterium]
MNAPRRFVDLHTHSTASDGADTPAEVVRLADRLRLAAVALTDHDTTAGLAEARAAARDLPALRFVAGVEVSAAFSPGTLHVLGLGIDESSAELQDMAARFRAARQERNPKIIARLQALGVPVDMDDVLAAAGGGGDRPGRIISRVHVAEAIVRAGFAADRKDAFTRYVGAGAAAYVPKERMEAGEIIAAIHAAAGAAVMAHPTQLQLDGLTELERLTRRLMDVGLDGIEVYHGDHTNEQTRQYLDLACRLGLLITGGSDYHGAGKPDVSLGRPVVPASVLREPWASCWL